MDILEETHWLRSLLWFVAIAAVLGNFTVLGFTLTSQAKGPLTVTKFLICNLGSFVYLELPPYDSLLLFYELSSGAPDRVFQPGNMLYELPLD